jgi:hypothetical protein
MVNNAVQAHINGFPLTTARAARVRMICLLSVGNDVICSYDTGTDVNPHISKALQSRESAESSQIARSSSFLIGCPQKIS